MKTEDMILMPVPVTMYTAVCALLGGASMLALKGSTGNSDSGGNVAGTGVAPTAAEEKSGAAAAAPTPSPSPAPSPSPSAAEASPAASDDGEIDAHGHPWSADMHASTKGKTKDGLWRMKVGVSRPDPLPGFPKDEPSTDTGTSQATPTPSATSQDATDQGSGQPATSGDDDDEFAAFRAAANASATTDQAAAAAAPTTRPWTDADLGALCNQAAVKLGDPAPIKEIIGQYVPEGEVAHSRNIPPEKREDFAKAVEAKAGIEFAG
jgi:hypothetical protein